jgi:hypothetical protein
MSHDQFKRRSAIVAMWDRDGYVIRDAGRWIWTEKARQQLAPVLTSRKPWSAAEGIDDGSLGVTLA